MLHSLQMSALSIKCDMSFGNVQSHLMSSLASSHQCTFINSEGLHFAYLQGEKKLSQKLKFQLTIKILVKNQSFNQKSKFCSKIPKKSKKHRKCFIFQLFTPPQMTATWPSNQQYLRHIPSRNWTRHCHITTLSRVVKMPIFKYSKLQFSKYFLSKFLFLKVLRYEIFNNSANVIGMDAVVSQTFVQRFYSGWIDSLNLGWSTSDMMIIYDAVLQVSKLV